MEGKESYPEMVQHPVGSPVTHGSGQGEPEPPGWCVRNVKFNGGDGARLGREVVAFTEHASLVHVVDALTFETHDIIRVLTVVKPESRRHHLRQSSAPSIIVSSPDTNTTTSSIPSSPAQQWRVRRHFARSMLPVKSSRSELPVYINSVPSRLWCSSHTGFLPIPSSWQFFPSISHVSKSVDLASGLGTPYG